MTEKGINIQQIADIHFETEKDFKNCLVYQKIDDKTRLRLLKLVKEKNWMIKEAAAKLKINYSTAKTIMRVFNTKKRILRIYKMNKAKIFKITKVINGVCRTVGESRNLRKLTKNSGGLNGNSNEKCDVSSQSQTNNFQNCSSSLIKLGIPFSLQESFCQNFTGLYEKVINLIELRNSYLEEIDSNFKIITHVLKGGH
jgi:hypothetical protein